MIISKIAVIPVKIVRSFLALLYPPLCLHCNQGVRFPPNPLCEWCIKQLELIDPSERCSTCFSSEISEAVSYCTCCLKQPPLWQSMAAAFDYEGPASSLIRQFKYGNQPYLAKGAAAFMAAQFLRLNWEMPDLIIPVPMPLLKKWDRGYNQTELLAAELGNLLQVPVQQRLRRSNGTWSQAGLSRHQRLEISLSTFQLKKGDSLSNKHILLIDDVITTGSTLRCCAEVILEEYPATISTLAFCRAG